MAQDSVGVSALKRAVELLADEGTLLSGTSQDKWDESMIIRIEVEVCGLVFDDDGLTEIGFEAISHASIIGTENDFIVAFESQGQFFIDFRDLRFFI